MWTVPRRWFRRSLLLVVALALAAGPLSLTSVAAASLVVTSGDDSGPGTLRAVIAAAAPGATITFAPGVKAVTLTSGQLNLVKDLTIAAGLDGVTIRRSAATETTTFRVLFIGARAKVTLQRLTITNGVDNGLGGGGILNLSSTLTLLNCVVGGNTADSGGGILSYAYDGNATLTAIGTVISDNMAYFAGGVFNDAYSGQANTTLLNSIVRANRADGGGGGVMNRRLNLPDDPLRVATLTLTNTLVSDNTAGGSGGGVANASGTVTIRNSTIDSNTAGDNGGGIDNTAATDAAAIVRITSSTVSGNTAHSGGGLYNVIFAAIASATIQASTFSGNRAQHSGGGIGNSAYVGELSLTLDAVTMADNIADSDSDGIGLGHQVNVYAYTNGRARTVIGQSVFGHADADLVGYFAATTGGTGSIEQVSNGYNVSQRDLPFAPASGDIADTNPLLGPLTDNGGLSLTRALRSNSPAIDRVTSPDAKCYFFDQRGVARPQGAACDSGAFETQGTPPLACGQWFNDVSASNPACRAISALFAHGIVKGYVPDDCFRRKLIAPCFGPDDPVERAQVAAMIVRAFAWQNEPAAVNPFDDLDGLAPELLQAILILKERGIFQGYDSNSAGPTDRVSFAQAISIVARSFVIAGYWEDQPGAIVPYSGVPAVHAADVATTHHYLGAIPDAPDTAAGWNSSAPRALIARLIALALQSISSP